MKFSSFNTNNYDHLKQPLFLGESVNVSRFDQQRFKVFESLIDKQLGFFWRPEEFDVSKDRRDFYTLSEAEQHIFISNLQYQILLDSVQGRSPNVAFLPITSLPEFETWAETWAFYETIHSRSYTHIIRNVFNNPSEIFDKILVTPEIIERGKSIGKYYDDLIEYSMWYNLLGVGIHTVNGTKLEISTKELKKRIYLATVAVNVLEGIRFYVSFACSFSFAERNLMQENANIIRKIAADESLHLQSTQHMINIMESDSQFDPEMVEVTMECRDEATKLFWDANEQEKKWASYLFSTGSMIGLSEKILYDYIDYITAKRLVDVGFNYNGPKVSNPLPWMNTWLNTSNLQISPQEQNLVSYLVGAVNSEVKEGEFLDFEL